LRQTFILCTTYADRVGRTATIGMPDAASRLHFTPPFEWSERNMGKYFLHNRELPEQEAANRWFAFAEENGIDIPRAISIWEDAATEEGEQARRLVSAAGITLETP
jgi:hypothetical protein